ncbi:glycosyltransferase family 9 protein [Billgrantia desiderata]|uniref:glycosyltransferase family 9 protein n=1 Tax=Billgrantia desiderata TaxID=52021 RepID=UPI000A39B218|nr:glycosyltransferase family 9 protein [Halomonas desiderata]
MKKYLHAFRAKRDDWRIALSRWRYDRCRPEVERVSDLKRVVFLRWDAKWGDSIIFSLVVPELRKLGTGISVEVIATPEMAPLFTEQLGVDRVHVIPKRPSGGKIRRLAASLGEVDLLVHFSELAKARDICLLGSVKARHVASLDDSVGLVDIKLGQATRGLHMEERYCELLKRCGIATPERHYTVPRDSGSERRVAAFLQERTRPYVAINPFSKGGAKTFSVETTLALIERVERMAAGHDICLLTVPGCERAIQAITAGWNAQRCFLYPHTQSIYDNVALLAAATAQLSSSTATVHIADGLGIPSFVLFPYSPGEMAAWHSVNPRSINLMGQPGEVDDVNRLDWDELDRQLKRFVHTALVPSACPGSSSGITDSAI